MKILLSLLLAFSCGDVAADQRTVILKGPVPKAEIGQEFADILAEFTKDAEHYGADLSLLPSLRRMSWVDIEEPNVAGRCTTHYHPGGALAYTEIELDMRYKAEPLSAQARGLIYHELGHCVLLKPHRMGQYIMNPSLLYAFIYTNYWDELIRKLFTGAEE